MVPSTYITVSSYHSNIQEKKWIECCIGNMADFRKMPHHAVGTQHAVSARRMSARRMPLIFNFQSSIFSECQREMVSRRMINLKPQISNLKPQTQSAKLTKNINFSLNFI